MRQRDRRSGLSALMVSFIILAVTALAGTSLMAYRHQKSSSAKNSAAANQTQAATQPQSAATTQPAQATTQYLVIREWGVKMPLSANIKDAYYVVSASSVQANGQPDMVLLGLKSLDSSGCSAAGPNAGKSTNLGAIGRSSVTQTDPVSGEPYTKEYPNGTTLGSYHYFYEDSTSARTCASHNALHGIGSAFATAVKGIVSDSTN